MRWHQWVAGVLALWLVAVTVVTGRRARGRDPPPRENSAKDEEEEREISRLLKETDFIKMLEQNAEKNDKRLGELQERLESELGRVNRHFEEMLERIHESEMNIEKNLEKVELTVLGQVQNVREKASESQGSWKWPFIILVLALMGLSGFFARLYQKATKHSHFL